MRLVVVILLSLQTKLAIASDDKKEHVHFKIYVPEIINHHIHTKTVFIHVHKPKPKKNDHVESDYENWNYWNSYNNYDEQGDRKNGERSAIRAYSGNQGGQGGHYPHQGPPQVHATPYESLLTAPGPPPPATTSEYPTYYRDHLLEQQVPHYDDYQENYQTPEDQNSGNDPILAKSVFTNGITGYSYPPQYAVHENVVEDIPQNTPESYKNSHEQGHKKRHHSQTGHLYSNELNNFYNDKHEESGEAVSVEHQEAEESKNRKSRRYIGSNRFITKKMTSR